MKDQLKKFFKHKWVIGTGTSVLASVIVFISPKLQDFFLNEYLLPLWGILLFIGIPFILFLAIRAILSNYNKVEIIPEPKFVEYRADKFDGVTYRWRYTRNENGKYSISVIMPHCPICDCPLVGVECPNCQDDIAHPLRDDSEIKALIMHRGSRMK